MQIDTKVKPFIPDYIPAIGEVDAFLKINRPDNINEDIGLNFIDEPTIQGIDPSIFSLELSYKMKVKPNANMHIKAVDNADKNPKQIQNWITQISDLHKEKMSSSVSYSKKMPDIESLMQVIII
jgi:intraflagellar transport protein 46